MPRVGAHGVHAALSNLNLLEEKRLPRYSLKLTDDEHERIEERAAASGRSVAAYVRAAALGEL
ncbi:plasmid mobilization protein [Gemmatimonas sp.]